MPLAYYIVNINIFEKIHISNLSKIRYKFLTKECLEANTAVSCV